MSAKTDPPRPVSQPADEKVDEYDEVTETRIVGITDTGVIRKRSFKRKVKREDKSSRGYGHNHDEYEKIRKQVLESKMATESVSGLSQRFKLIQMMHEDCMDLVQGWKKTREERMRKEQGHYLQTTVLGAGAIVCIVVFVSRWLFL